MGNKTEEYPQGVLNGDILKTFYGITGEDGNFQYNRGHERIPDNWRVLPNVESEIQC
jgi:hypothetical protein